MLNIKNLTIAFPRNGQTNPVVRNVSFSIEKGEILALVGESGSGKSLTALSILDLLPPAAQRSGNITYDSSVFTSDHQPIRAADLRGNQIAMIFQEPMTALNPLHTIRRQIGEMIEIHQPQMNTRQVEEKILSLLDEVGLTHLKSRLGAYPHQLSGGERQRVMIAMAIANSPKLLIADEPTTAVDVTVQLQILKLIKELQKSRGMSVLFITHDLTIVRKIADRVTVMKAGEIVEIGKTADVFAKPQHPYTKKLLDSEPKSTPLPLPPNPETIITAAALNVRFPLPKKSVFSAQLYKAAVDTISLEIHEGETLGIVGESGSGKSTLGYALLKLLKSQGKIVFIGRDISALPPAVFRPYRKSMQIVFQDPFSSLNPRFTIRDIVGEGLRVFPPENIGFRSMEEAVVTALQEVGLTPDMLDRYPHEFSGGQRQRISIARSVILKPKFIVLDEPTSALDLTVQTQILDLLKSLQKNYKIGYLFISHDLRVVRSISHRIMVMKEGKVVETGFTEDIFSVACDDYTKKLIEAAFIKSI